MFLCSTYIVFVCVLHVRAARARAARARARYMHAHAYHGQFGVRSFVAGHGAQVLNIAEFVGDCACAQRRGLTRQTHTFQDTYTYCIVSRE